MLQSAPSILFTLFAGPLSDQYGRKPLILSALFGYFLLNIVFFVNSYWFYQLSAEYLLLECLQVQLFCKQLCSAGFCQTPKNVRGSAEIRISNNLEKTYAKDLTGGAACFYLASYSYMVDITQKESRTRPGLLTMHY